MKLKIYMMHRSMNMINNVNVQKNKRIMNYTSQCITQMMNTKSTVHKVSK